MLVMDFVTENKNIIIKQNGNTLIKEVDLILYLRRAYTHLQRDKTLFTKTMEMATVTGQKEYPLEANTKDVLHLFVDGVEYEKKRIDEFFEQYFFNNSSMYGIDNEILYINPEPAAGKTMLVFYEVIKDFEEDAQGRDTFTIPILFKEALRYLFLSKVHEEAPRNEFVDLSMHYFKLYQGEMIEAMKSSKVKYSNLKADYQKI